MFIIFQKNQDGKASFKKHRRNEALSGAPLFIGPYVTCYQKTKKIIGSYENGFFLIRACARVRV